MFRVTRKQLITDSTAAEASVIRFEDSTEFDSYDAADLLKLRLLSSEMSLGGVAYGPSKVVFKSPAFYRSVTVTIEEIK